MGNAVRVERYRDAMRSSNHRSPITYDPERTDSPSATEFDVRVSRAEAYDFAVDFADDGSVTSISASPSAMIGPDRAITRGFPSFTPSAATFEYNFNINSLNESQLINLRNFISHGGNNASGFVGGPNEFSSRMVFRLLNAIDARLRELAEARRKQEEEEEKKRKQKPVPADTNK
jgi:FtsP/CotA-like multicopper oxidase with cupredoxin domain